MNIWQTILKAITFGAYDPEKKFEQEVLGEATINLEEIESLREGVEKTVDEFDKYFPRESNKSNMYWCCEISTMNPVESVIEAEKKLQEKGKYIGMDEEKRISAVLSEGMAAGSAKCLSVMSKRERELVKGDVLEAFRISEYQGYMKLYTTGERETNAGGWKFLEEVHGASQTVETLERRPYCESGQ